ncbi:MAG: metallophosphoesterase [Clostridiales bacterium]|nr:metallophosphoesterase [Clostridiales bacterium]
MNLRIGIIIAMAGVLLIGVYLFLHFRKLPFFTRFHIRRWVPTVLASVFTIFCILGAINIFSIEFVIVFFLFQMYLLTDVIGLIITKIIKKEKVIRGWKRLYCGGILCFVLTFIYLIVGYVNAKNVQTTTYEVHSDKLSQGENLSIAVIGDLHYGTIVNKENLEKYCKQISDNNVDLVLLVGDIVDQNTTNKEVPEAFQILGGTQSTYGTFYVYGNHDMAVSMLNPPIWKYQLEQYITHAGITILEDSSKLINDSIYVIGREDIGYTGKSTRADISKLTEKLLKDKFWILLDHQPKEIDVAKEHGVDLMLSGHTHGGQLWPVGFFSELLGIDEFTYGDKKIDQFHAIVTSGIGGWGYPIRTGSKAEIVYITVIGDK